MVVCVCVLRLVSVAVGLFCWIFGGIGLVLAHDENTEFSCAAFGKDYEKFPKLRQCYKFDGYVRNGLIINDPDDANKQEPLFQFIARVQANVKTVRMTELGILTSFIRFQADFNPGISSDKIYSGLINDPIGVGVDGAELALKTRFGTFKAGKIQNAVTNAMPYGFTHRSAESLNGRSATGVGYQRNIGKWDVAVSLSDPSATTSASSRVPNLGVGINYRKGPWTFGVGGAFLHVDRIIPLTTNIPIRRLVERGAPFVFGKTGERGWAAGASVRYSHENKAAYLGIGYTKAASNDALFAFSDGFSAVSTFVGASIAFTQRLKLGADVSFVAGTNKGFRDKRGVEAAVRLSWQPVPRWSVAAEVGYDTVPDFGAGDGFFYSLENPGRLDFRLTVDRFF